MGKSGKNDDAKASDICGTCRGSGTVPCDVLETFRGPDGESVGVTRSRPVTCPQCKGLGEYPSV